MKGVIRETIGLLSGSERRLATILAVVAAGSSILEAATAGLVFVLFAVLQGQGGQLGAWFSGLAARLGEANAVIVACMALLAVIIVRAAVFLLTIILKGTLSMRVAKSLIERLMSAYLARPIEKHLQTNPSNLTHTLLQGSYNAAYMAISSLVELATEVMAATALIVLLLVVSPGATLLALTVLGAVAALLLAVSRRSVIHWGHESQAAQAEVQRLSLQSLQGIKTLKAYGRESWFLQAIQKSTADYTGYNRRYAIAGQLPRLVLELLVFAALVASLVIAVWMEVDPAAIIPTLALLGIASYRLMPAVIRITAAVNNLRYSAPLLHTVAEDLRQAGKERPPAIDTSVRSLQDGIELRGIGFAYATRKEPVLKDVNIRIRKGSVVAFAGVSGSGKTTLADILLGLLSPTEGRLVFDGREFNSFRSLPRHLFGYVPQDTFVLDDTLRANVALGLERGEIDDAKVRRALSLSALDEVVAGLPAGLDTRLGDRGARLSGGQRQRLAIARALYHDPEIIVFDEATSALDALTEEEVVRTIDLLRGEKTIVLIAHRLSTVRKADCVFFFENRTVAASGSFDELQHRSPTFRAMLERMSTERDDDRTAA